MPKRQFAIHGTAKGKHSFDHVPVANVYADDETDAKRQGELITRSNPIYNEHFSDNGIHAKELG